MIAEIVISETVSAIGKRFKESITERWTRHRAEKFFEGFIQRLASEGVSGDGITSTLNEILEDEAKSEVLFDAYRTVCLAKSKNLGPKIVGLLTAMIVSEDRTAEPFEEEVFRAAETLADDQLLSLAEEFQRRKIEADEPETECHWQGDSIVIKWVSRDYALSCREESISWDLIWVKCWGTGLVMLSGLD